MSEASTDQDPKELPLVAHLIELRNRLLRSIAVVLVLFLLLFAWSGDIYEFVSAPLASQLENNIISTSPMDPFLVPMKLTFMVSVFLAIPYILHQAWAFISPGLYQNEIRVTMPILISSVVLFYAGLAFCYFVVLGFVFNFFINSAPETVAVMTDMGAYYSFAMTLFLVFGVVFEIPVATILLVISGVTTPQDLAAKRPYIIIGCFIVAVPLTPPDPLSLFMMALPMWLLFEIGMLGSRLFYKPDPDDTPDTPDETTSAS
ncbi:MAG TPA: twin-arginine translocase subunit TatC [Pseudomonadaceae bacterium]|nr:twin-arginine translocase subunit TatC [Pseudomonadaceae bacterium]